VEAVRNWRAFLSVPLVFLGLAPDFWRPFEDYASVEEGRRSTFFVVPFKDRPGIAPDGLVAPRRAVPYQASEIRDEIAKAMSRGSEVAVHGIDAWRDADAGRAELKELNAVTGQTAAGVRMHWLYFTEDAAHRLEAAGFGYDSTCGFNDAVGYRAGTSQVFRLPGTRQLMELPLVIMDTALFYGHRMGLDAARALQLCRQIVAHARDLGGTVVINWHERSLAPERLWGRAYGQLLEEVGTGDRTWFATATQTVDWFRWRRSIRFERDADCTTVVVATAESRAARPSALMRVYRPDRTAAGDIQDIRFDGDEPLKVEL
jgi:hypothetical protein